jgi:hypothetical protein
VKVTCKRRGIIVIHEEKGSSGVASGNTIGLMQHMVYVDAGCRLLKSASNQPILNVGF